MPQDPKTFDYEAVALMASRIFTPASPVTDQAIFAGRQDQVRQIVDAINQPGQHVIVYGERGVGKTSIANIISTKITTPGFALAVPKVNCDGTDDFSSVWRKAFGRVTLTQPSKPAAGFKAPAVTAISNAIVERLPKQITPEEVRKALVQLRSSAVVAVVIDEFDRITSPMVRGLFADTIKMLADEAVPATVILVGVADTVDKLIQDHLSIQRSLVQVRMPRMLTSELEDVVKKGMVLLDMAIDARALSSIAILSHGLPHYTHLLALKSVREALDDGSRRITSKHVDRAISKALDGAQQSIKASYHRATASHRAGNLYSQVLLACALAKADGMGYFGAADVRSPLSQIMGRPYEIPSFVRHLSDFCDTDRGPTLERSGVKHRYRYRFRDPLMQPFVAIKGAAEKVITEDTIKALVD